MYCVDVIWGSARPFVKTFNRECRCSCEHGSQNLRARDSFFCEDVCQLQLHQEYAATITITHFQNLINYNCVFICHWEFCIVRNQESVCTFTVLLPAVTLTFI